MTPKLIDGSFVALFEQADVINDYVKQLADFNIDVEPSPARRRRIKGLMVSDKQYSLDSRMDIVSTIVATMGNGSRRESTGIPATRKAISSDGEYLHLDSLFIYKNDKFARVMWWLWCDVSQVTSKKKKLMKTHDPKAGDTSVDRVDEKVTIVTTWYESSSVMVEFTGPNLICVLFECM